MCGIVSVFGNISVQLENVFKQMLIVDQLRGAHSTGMFSAGRHVDNVKIAKALGTPEALMDTKSFDQAMQGIHRALVGHNRYATQGAVTKHNAHPFEFDNVVGVHNGSLTNYTALEGYGQFPVDSQVLYNHLDKHGIRSVVEKSSGPMALVWWNKKENSMNIFRNKDRPLFYGITKTDAIILGSEFGMVDWICDRNGVELTALEPVPVDMHMQFVIPKGSISLSKPKAEQIIKPATVLQVVFPRSTASTNGNENNKNVLSAYGTASRGNREAPGTTAARDEVLNNQGELYEVISTGKLMDVPGVFCKSDDFPHDRFFVYQAKDAPTIKVGDFVQGNVAGFNAGLKGAGYYYLSLVNLQHYPVEPEDSPVVDAPAKVVDEEDGDPVGGNMFLTPSGRDISPKEWIKKYGICAHCNGDTEYDTCMALPSRDAVICNECSVDPVVRDALTV